MSNLFFDSRGKPRIASVKQACLAEVRLAEVHNTPLAYITTFKLDSVYSKATTGVAANALRLLFCSTALQDRWSVIVYHADAQAQFDAVDKEYHKLWRGRGRDSPEEEADLAAVQKWKKRCDYLAEFDLRPFLRAGFQQVPELAQDSTWMQIFAVPSFLQASSMMTHDEAVSVPFLRMLLPPSKRPPPSNWEQCQTAKICKASLQQKQPFS